MLNLSVPTTRLLISLCGYLASGTLFLVLRHRAQRSHLLPLSIRQRFALAIGIILGSLAGAALIGYAESFQFLWHLSSDGPIPPATQVSLGAMLGGWIGLEIAKRIQQTTHPSGDLFVFPMIVAIAFSRIAAFLNPIVGQRSGLPTSLPWCVDFGDGIPRHPTQLYEVIFILLLAAILLGRIRRQRQRGCMFSQFVFAYLAFAFLLDFLRPRYALAMIPLPLSIFQLAAFVGMAHALLHWNDTCCDLPCATGGSNTTNTAPQPPHFVELTNSLCPTCLRTVEAKVLIEQNEVYLQKFCPDHGLQRVLIADDAAYWRESRSLYKPPTSPQRRNTSMQRGCPHDCGICPDHEQHSCLAIVEITDQCDLACPVCYASCSPSPARQHRSLAQIASMLDAAVANETLVNVVQISGGEPTLHPDLFAIFDMVKARPIRHLMLNTNGRRIARDENFVRRLADYLPGFEVYLQFDSLRPQTLIEIRGVDLSETRRRAVAMLEKYNISTTLVVTLKKGVNDDQIGEILEFATRHKCIRGVTFQPIQAAGRLDDFDPARHRLTLTEVRSAILRQHKLFTPADIVPVPCHTDALAMAYAIRIAGRLIPLSRITDPRQLLQLGGNTICYEQDPRLRNHVMQLFSASASPASAAESLSNLCCIPDLPPGTAINYQNVFRIIIMQFMDAWSMDLRSLKRSCVHIVQPDGRLIPFETCNLFHRDQ